MYYHYIHINTYVHMYMYIYEYVCITFGTTCLLIIMNQPNLNF